MRRITLTSIGFIGILFSFFQQAISASLPDGFTEQVIVENIDPVGMTITPDGRILIVEKDGIIRIVKDDIILEDPFLEIPVDNYNERGLQNIILDPLFEINNYVYIFYTSTRGTNVVSRFTVNGDFALAESEVILFESDPISGAIHNGGGMVIDSDRKLYFGFGESGVGENANDLTNVLGKVMRINLDGSIPEDNPFYNTLEGKNKAIYAYGFRNPFSMDIDYNTGQILVTDVGGGRWEEVNMLEPGVNFGWPTIEGYKESWQTEPDNHQTPYYAFYHDQGRCAIVGASFYKPSGLFTFPEEYWNKFFFADYCSGEMFYIDPATGDYEGIFATNLDRLVSIKVADNGDMYYLQRSGIGDGSIGDNTSTTEGSLIRIKYTGSGEPFITRQPSSQTIVIGEDAQFNVLASGFAPLTYSWKVNGEQAGSDTSKLILENPGIELNEAEISVTISNQEGLVYSDTAILYISNNTRPEPEITSPEDGAKYRAGETLQLTGTAIDNEDGTLDSEKLSWKIDFHHDEHFHPAMFTTTGNNLTYAIPNFGETSPNVWYRVHLTATDSEGFSKTVYKDVFPYKSHFSIQTYPQGAPVKLDGKEIGSDTTVESVVGLQRVISAGKYSIKGDYLYTFEKWGNDYSGSTLMFTVTESDTTLKAYFSKTALGSGEGLNLYYYNNSSDFYSQNPNVTDLGNVNFNWGYGSPDGMPIDYFFARFEGFIQPVFSGEYTFYVSCDDGVNLWVDNQQLINDWTAHAQEEFFGSIELTAGVLYPIKLEYFEAGGNAVVEMRWSAEYQTKEIIPTRQLYANEVITGNSIAGEQDILLYPNPAKNHLNVSGLNHKNGFIKVTDVSGRVLLNSPHNLQTPIDVSRLKSGLYHVEIRWQNNLIQQSIIIR